MADDDLEFPRWEHHDEFKSELVNDETQRAALLKRWERGEGRPKSAAPFRPVRPVAPVEIAPPPAPPAPAFTVYDITTDKDVPLTQDRLDELLLAEQVVSTLWPAIRHDGEATLEGAVTVPFPPETSIAIAKVQQILDADQMTGDGTVATVDLENGTVTVAPKRRGRPPKPKPETP